MTLDDIEKLADLFANHHDVAAISTADASVDMARALLIFLPVVRAAEAWHANEMAGVHGYANKYAAKVLKDAIDELRRKLGQA